MDTPNVPDVEQFVDLSERLMRYLEIVAAFVLVGLFGIGVFDFLLQIVTLVRTGAITDTASIIGLIDEILLLFGSSDPYMVSFFISDRIISQILAVVVLVGITYLVVRELPELLTVIEDVLFMVTGDEYDLESELGLERPGA